MDLPRSNQVWASQMHLLDSNVPSVAVGPESILGRKLRPARVAMVMPHNRCTCVQAFLAQASTQIAGWPYKSIGLNPVTAVSSGMGTPRCRKSGSRRSAIDPYL